MNATVTCEKCGKPLGVFDGNVCNECENNAVLDKIRDEVSAILTNSYDEGVKEKALQIIDKYKAESKGDKE